jgi:hypothetical protein
MWSQEWQDLLQPGVADDFFTAMPDFAPPRHLAFDARFALWMAEFCRLIYRQGLDERPASGAGLTLAEIIGSLIPRWGNEYIINGLHQRHGSRAGGAIPLPAEDTQAAIYPCPQPECAVLVFRGNLGARNLLTDLSFLAAPDGEQSAAAIHTGFASAVALVWPQVRAALLRTRGPLHLTGHSLGAALATLTASRMQQDPELSPRLATLHTFGCPRLATGGFAPTLGGLFHARIVLGDDLVTKLPPAFSLPLFPDYQHCGRGVQLSPEGSYEILNEGADEEPDLKAGMAETAELLRKLLALPELSKFGAPAKPLRDHTPRLYTEALRRAAARMA